MEKIAVEKYVYENVIMNSASRSHFKVFREFFEKIKLKYSKEDDLFL
jgi:hypothetical protein